MPRTRVLIVDDEEGMLEVCADTLSRLPDATVETERDSRRAAERIEHGAYDLLITDIRMPGIDGIELLRRARQRDPGLAVLLITAYPSVETAVESLRLGASDYVAKPFVPSDLLAAAGRLIETKALREENALLQRQANRGHDTEEIVAACPRMLAVREAIERAAATDVDVLIVGEPGTGREETARLIHRRGRRSAGRFVAADCDAIPPSQLDAEFFGREPDGDEGASSWTLGLIEFADGGTFFLSEVGQLPLHIQARLVRVLQERATRRGGGGEERLVDLRVVCATSRELDAEVRAGRFRADLYYAISAGRIELPPLRERGEDLPLLVERFVGRFAREMRREAVRVEPDAMATLARYAWPGNVRELQNVLRRALAMGCDEALTVDDLPEAIVAQASERSPEGEGGFFRFRRQRIEAFEREYLVGLMRTCQGDVPRAVREARIPRGTLYRLLKKHGLLPEDFRA